MTQPQSGGLRARITIEQEVPIAQGGGSYAPNWQTVASLWAQIEPVAGRVVRQGERLESRVTHRITVRYRSDIAAGMRVVWGSQLFAIQAVINLGAQNRFTQLLVSLGGAT